MLIRSFGLFWQRDAVEWTPSRGTPRHLYGRLGTNKPGIKVVDFKDQIGLYVLYSAYGPYYVGLTRDRLASRLANHTQDDHGNGWDRFSWFGFRAVLKTPDKQTGIRPLAAKASSMRLGTTSQVIGDIEALTIKVLGCGANWNSMKFQKADEWTQIPSDDPEGYLAKVQP